MFLVITAFSQSDQETKKTKGENVRIEIKIRRENREWIGDRKWTIVQLPRQTMDEQSNLTIRVAAVRRTGRIAAQRRQEVTVVYIGG